MLDFKVAVYVPSVDRDGNKVDQKAHAEDVARLFSQGFGGATAYPATGYWVNGRGDLVEEEIIKVEGWTTSDRATEAENLARGIAYMVCKRAKQEAVTIEVNGRMEFVEHR